MHPGIAGHSATITPVSSGSNVTRSFILGSYKGWRRSANLAALGFSLSLAGVALPDWLYRKLASPRGEGRLWELRLDRSRDTPALALGKASGLPQGAAAWHVARHKRVKSKRRNARADAILWDCDSNVLQRPQSRTFPCRIWRLRSAYCDRDPRYHQGEISRGGLWRWYSNGQPFIARN
jgi:hypothetical protein